jgi:hypothetical protein
MGEKAPQEIRERVWVEKFDHSGDTPTLVETAFVETVKRVGEPPQRRMAVIIPASIHEESDDGVR